MTSQALFYSSVALTPLAGRCVVAEDNKADRYKNDQDSRDHKRHSPRLVRGKSILHKSFVHCRHDKVSNASAEISKAPGERIGRADNILVEEPSGPDLARHKATSEDTNEEPERVQTGGVEHSSSKEGRYCTSKQAAGKGQTRTKAITCWACDEAHNQCGCEGDDVGICDLVGFHAEVASDDVGEKGWEG